jgi:dolichol-phosphate mannosyltransferase
MGTQARTTVLIPTYMEAGTICRLIDQLRDHLPDAHVLVVDDQSPDGTAALVRESYRDSPAVEVILRRGARGFGAAMSEGVMRFLASSADRLITIDADLSHDPALTTRMLDQLQPGGIVIGSRYLYGTPQADWAVGRMLISIVGNRYIRWITRLPAADCTSGFRCYSRAALERAGFTGTRARGYAFEVEILYRIWRAGCPIAEVPIRYRDRLVGDSKLDLKIVVESLIVPWRLVRQARRQPPAVPRQPAASADQTGATPLARTSS